MLALGPPARAATPDAGFPADAGSADAGAPPPTPRYESTVRAERGEAPADRATSTVGRSDLDRRLPRSAPDALRYEPGVFVQQTAHAQGSAYIRGLTGQQTLMLFDGVRLNNSTYRQGPNQYFFTLDARSLDSIEVLRGGGSTRFGSDALGGVLLAHPLEAPRTAPASFVRPTLLVRGGSADDELGGRLQLEAGQDGRWGIVVGGGGRRVGELESGGAVKSPATGEIPDVPRFAEDGRTQLGTGFKELTGDARLTIWPAPDQALTLAAYLYRQFDAPRTDQCPPPGARWDECLTYDQQFRTLVYGAWALEAPEAGREAQLTLSWQQQHERRRGERPASFVVNRGVDDVDTLGIAGRGAQEFGALGPARLKLLGGVDTYLDLVRSQASLVFTDVDVEVERSRGQYLDGSSYLYGGAWLDAEARLPRGVGLSAGGRLSWIHAASPADPASGTAGVDASWFPVVGHAGASWEALPGLTLRLNLDHSFRAPNLDDLTSRQQTGPGFQFENPDLGPERATTVELGAEGRGRWLSAEAWGFATVIHGAIGRRPRDIADCPPSTPQCQGSWSRFQLVNAGRASEIFGVEGAAKLRLPFETRLRATVAWAWGEGPNLSDPPSNPALPYDARAPLSRIPPLNGTVELFRTPYQGLGAAVALRWALKQDRLAVADLSDTRIPLGGTPGFAVVDLRLSYRHGRHFVVAAALENLFDAAYRYHGSSVNGPGRSFTLSLELSPFD